MTSPASDPEVLEGVNLDGPTRQEAATKRAWQAAAQGLAIDVAVGVALLVIAQFDTITSAEGFALFAVAVGKTVVITAAQYVVRRWRDSSGFNDRGEPVAAVVTPKYAATPTDLE